METNKKKEMNKESLLKRFITEVESTLPNIPITDSLEQIFNKEFKDECWLKFTHFFLKEINFTPNEGYYVEVVYNVNGNAAGTVVIWNQSLSQLGSIDDPIVGCTVLCRIITT